MLCELLSVCLCLWLLCYLHLAGRALARTEHHTHCLAALLDLPDAAVVLIIPR